ncbi:MAG: hypothetical protein PsegKO_29750 [Pseudohongiellaceae bacterium]
MATPSPAQVTWAGLFLCSLQLSWEEQLTLVYIARYFTMSINDLERDRGQEGVVANNKATALNG